MFSLIISIISIALVAALAAATVYFGGAAFNKGSAGADASTFINAGQQVAGAFTLAAADGHSADTVAKLNLGIDGDVYLAQIPSYKGTSIDGLSEKNPLYVAVKVSDQVCDEIVKRAVSPTAVVGAAQVFTPSKLFGCQLTSDAVKTFTDGTATGPVTYAENDHIAFYKVK